MMMSLKSTDKQTRQTLVHAVFRGLVFGDSLAEALRIALRMPDRVVCDQPLWPAAAAEAFINTLQRLDRAANGQQQRKL